MASKTYTNTEFGFQVEIPAQAEITMEEYRIVPGATDQIWTVQFEDTSRKAPTFDGSNFNLLVQITPNPKNGANIFITEGNFLKSFNLNDTTRPTEVLNLQGRKAVKESYTTTNQQGDKLFNGFNITYQIFDAQTQQLILIYGYTHDISILSAEKLDQIVSTFKFL